MERRRDMPTLREILTEIELKEIETLFKNLDCVQSKREVRKINKQIEKIYSQAKARYFRNQSGWKGKIHMILSSTPR